MNEPVPPPPPPKVMLSSVTDRQKASIYLNEFRATSTYFSFKIDTYGGTKRVVRLDAPLINIKFPNGNEFNGTVEQLQARLCP